eukprot:6488626-Amphidinium_carterae.1
MGSMDRGVGLALETFDNAHTHIKDKVPGTCRRHDQLPALLGRELGTLTDSKGNCSSNNNF